MTTTQRLVAALSILAFLGAAAYQAFLKRFIDTHGAFRAPNPIGNTDCTKIQGLEACEKIIVHNPSGLVYLACSTPYSRTQWAPYFALYNESGRSLTDHVAIYDPSTSLITRTKLSGFADSRGLNLHGMDVVPSHSDPNTLWVYLVNHRPQKNGQNAELGMDEAIELFKTKVGGNTLVHVKTFKDDSVVVTPNDISGSNDGKSFFFTNDRSGRTGPVGLKRIIVDAFNGPSTSVGYCHIDAGCKLAAPNLPSANGIVRVNDDTFYVASIHSAHVSVFSREADNSLVLIDQITLDRCPDNLTADSDGAIYASTFVNMGTFAKHTQNSSIPSPSSVLKISLNTDPKTAYFGEKYRVERIFEDDGSTVTGITTAFKDAERGRLYLHGLLAPYLVSCKL